MRTVKRVHIVRTYIFTVTYIPANISTVLLNSGLCGIKTRPKWEAFHVFIQNFDIIVMTETKLDSLDDITVPGFRLYTKNRVFFKESVRLYRCTSK